jgi:hypothetical protein
MFLIEIILLLIVLGVVIWGVRAIANVLPIEPAFKVVINVLVTIAVVIILVYYVIAPMLHHVAPLRLP